MISIRQECQRTLRPSQYVLPLGLDPSQSPRCLLSLPGNVQLGYSATPMDSRITVESLSQATTIIVPCFVKQLVPNLMLIHILRNLQINFVPLQLQWLLAHHSPQ